jgi:hypothetical protein
VDENIGKRLIWVGAAILVCALLAQALLQGAV